MGKRAKADAELRLRKAVQLKIAGLTYQEIADTPYGPEDSEGNQPTLYGHRNSAREAIMRALNQEYEEHGRDVEEIRTQELARLDVLYQLAFKRAASGDDKAVNTCLRIMEQRRKYIGGLEVPSRVDNQVSADDKFVEALAALAQLKGETAVDSEG